MRYTRQLQLRGFGKVAQHKLNAAKVLVVGAGGLGVPVLQYLAGMGVGVIGIVDGDTVSLTNLHRQVIYQEMDIGLLKAEVAKARLAAGNSEIVINAIPVKLDVDNALALISDYDLVVDATDNFSARYLINDACVILQKPFVYGAVHEFEGQVAVLNFQGGPTYRCLFPNPPGVNELPDCNTSGVLGIVPGLIGARQALAVVKMITGIGKIHSGYLHVFDFLQDADYEIKLTLSPSNARIESLQESYETVEGTMAAEEISIAQLQEWYAGNVPFLLLDVRQEAEYGEDHIDGAINRPHDLLDVHDPLFDTSTPIVLYCQTGKRSALAAGILRSARPELDLFHLPEGFEQWHQIQKG